MTIDEYKALYPQDKVFVQIDDTFHTFSDEEYEKWVIKCVYNINHPLP